jgi:hypothetical protein
MRSKAFEQSLRAMVRRKPFQSFTVELVSGDRIRIDHPEALVFRGGVAVFLSAAGVPTLFDHESVSQLTGATNGRASA